MCNDIYNNGYTDLCVAVHVRFSNTVRYIDDLLTLNNDNCFEASRRCLRHMYIY